MVSVRMGIQRWGGMIHQDEKEQQGLGMGTHLPLFSGSSSHHPAAFPTWFFVYETATHLCDITA